jgi:hypothetical protein
MAAARTGVPDFEHIRRKVPIREIARDLGLAISGNMVRCWRPENHQHGDRTSSVGLLIRKNTAKCFVCDSRPLSTIDLVMNVRKVELREAVRWIAACHSIPNIPKGKHVHSKQRWPERYRVGVGTSRLEYLVRAGVWAALSPAERSILAVIDTFSEGDTVTISYRGLMRYSGTASHSTISSALKRFQNIPILKKVRTEAENGFRSCSVFCWTLDDSTFLRKAEETRNAQHAEIELERTLRAKTRATRKAELLQVNTLSNQWSTGEFDATPRMERDSCLLSIQPGGDSGGNQ